MTRPLLALLICCLPAPAVSKFDLVPASPGPADFRIASGGLLADIYVSRSDWPSSGAAAEDLARDIEMVTGRRPAVRHDIAGLSGQAILVGTLGRSEAIDRLDRAARLATDRIRGRWEGSLVQVVEKPFPNVARALVLAGSDRRGTRYAVHEISDNIGVSPYFKLSGVLPPRRRSLFIRAGTAAAESSRVKYRGSFADDNRASTGVFMEPDSNGRLYGGWAARRGGWTTANYVAFGEWDALIRSKSNTYFPCEGMYTNIPFNNLPEGNDVLINSYGLVRSGGHLLAMLTTWVNEFPLWLKLRGLDPAEKFHYRANHSRVIEFWKNSIERNRNYEVLWPLGLRGYHDLEYTEPGVEDVPALVREATLEQARLLAETPGLASRDMIITGWRSDYGVLERGMVPAGAAYAFSDGALPGATWYDVVPLVAAEQRRRNPGAKWGAYFHNSVRMGTIQRVARDQTPGLAKLNYEFRQLLDHGMDWVWEINNGPLKGMHYANEYIATLGRDPDYWRDPARIDEFVLRVMRRDFGARHARAIARIFRRMDSRNLMNFGTLRRGQHGIGVPDPRFHPDPYTLLAFGDEYARAIACFEQDLAEAEAIRAQLEPQQRDGFWQTIIWPLKLHLNALRQHYFGYKATLAWKQGRRSAAVYLSEMEKAGREVSLNALEYQTVSGGFWNGYTQDEPREYPRGEEIWGHNSNELGRWYHEYASRTGYYSLTEPHRRLRQMVEAMSFPERAVLDVSVEGYDPGLTVPAISVFGNEKRLLDIGNRGIASLRWTARPGKPWLKVSRAGGEAHAADVRLWVWVDWSKAPVTGVPTLESLVIDGGAAGSRTVKIPVVNPASPRPEQVSGHVEAGGYLCVEAEHYSKKFDRSGGAWRNSPISFAFGGASVTAEGLTSRPPSPARGPELVYRLNFLNAGAYFLNFVIFDRTLSRNLHYSLDGGAPVLVDNSYPATERDEHVRNIPVRIDAPGVHELHVYATEPGVVLDQVVFTSAPADIGNFRITKTIPDTAVHFRGAVAPESFYRLPRGR